MLAESMTDGGMVTQVVVGDAGKSGVPARRCTLTRTCSEMGVHRRREMNAAAGGAGGADLADNDQDRPTPLQVSARPPAISTPTRSAPRRLCPSQELAF